MRGVEMQAEEKRLTGLGIGIDDIDGPASQQIGQIPRLADLRIVIPQILRIAGRRAEFMREVVKGADAKAIEMIVAALQRAEIGQPAQMPLADQRRLVAGFL